MGMGVKIASRTKERGREKDPDFQRKISGARLASGVGRDCKARRVESVWVGQAAAATAGGVLLLGGGR